MPLCPSCTSLTFAADATNTSCLSKYTFDVDCSSNPFMEIGFRLEYSSDNGVIDPFKRLENRTQFNTSFNAWIGNIDSYAYYTESNYTGNDDMSDIGTYTFSNQCNYPSWFGDTGTGYYRISARIKYQNGDICYQSSNSLLITFDGSGGNPIDTMGANQCVCNTSSAYLGSSELAYNYSATTSACPTDCAFESGPVFVLESNGDVNYHLPESIQDRTVKLFN